MNYFRIHLLLLLLVCTGCSFLHNGSAITEQIEGGKIIPDSASRIYIKPVNGRISDPEFKDVFLTRLKSAINLDGRLAVTSGESGADIILEVEVTEFSEQVMAFDNTGRPVKVRISVVVKVSMRVTDTGREKVSGRTTDVNIVYEVDKSVRSDVLRALADMCSERVVSIIHTGWDSGK